MSLVTNIIISTYYESPEVIAHVEAFEWEVRGVPRTIGTLNDISNTVDGTHHSNGRLYNTGLNYFPYWDFKEFLSTVKWLNPEGVVVIWRTEEGITGVWRPSVVDSPA